MTEDQAREKWCPMTRFNGGYTNHLKANNAMCVASDCMAWRVGTVSVTENSAMHSGKQTVQRKTGYCGLAGKL